MKSTTKQSEDLFTTLLFQAAINGESVVRFRFVDRRKKFTVQKSQWGISQYDVEIPRKPFIKFVLEGK